VPQLLLSELQLSKDLDDMLYLGPLSFPGQQPQMPSQEHGSYQPKSHIQRQEFPAVPFVEVRAFGLATFQQQHKQYRRVHSN